MPPAAAPPSKPAPPAPAPPSTPAPQPPAPAPGAPVKSSAEAFEDKFSDLDAAPPPLAPKPAPVAPEPKPEPAKPDVKPEPAVKVAPEPEHDVEEPPAVAKPSELREFAKRKGIQAAKATAELKQLRQKIEQMELEGPKESGDTSLLSEQLAAAQKRLEQYEGEIKTVRYEKSQEYKDKWEVPYTKALSRAYRDIGELTVTIPNPNDPDQPTERQATKADFDAVFQQPLGAATKLSKQLFGDSYTLVLQHRERIKELQEGAWAAVEEYRTKGSEKEQQDAARSKQEAAFVESAWKKANESMKQKGAEFFDERPDDAEGNELLKKGMDHAELAFDGDAINSYPLPQQIAIHARVKNWAGSFLRNRRDITALKAQLAEANATIEQLRGSGPGKPAPAADAAPSGGNKTLMEEFDEKVK